MPIYEYQCGKCGSVFEVIQKFSDTPLAEHDACGGAVERLISAPAFQFKGTGWYVTDYAKSGSQANGKKDSEKSEGKPAKSDGGNSEGKSETKSEPKSETKSEKKAESKPSTSST